MTLPLYSFPPLPYTRYLQWYCSTYRQCSETKDAADAETKPTPSAGGADVKVEEDDVKLVVAQTGCTEEKAREALKAENGDLINASESARRAGTPAWMIG